jgi:hypothetical protein
VDAHGGCVITWSTERLIDSYFQTLNESDAAKRAALIRRVWAEDGAFASPVGDARGHAAIDAQVAGFQSACPGTVVRRTSPVDILHERFVRFSFEALDATGATFIAGVDFGIVRDGRLRLMAGFFDTK